MGATSTWIEVEDNDFLGGGYVQCSDCGYTYSYGGYFEPDRFKFCPNCGIKKRLKRANNREFIDAESYMKNKYKKALNKAFIEGYNEGYNDRAAEENQ